MTQVIKQEPLKAPKVIVRVSFNRKAADYHQEHGWNNLVKLNETGEQDLVFEEVEFNSHAEAEAYCKGIGDGNGWDCPFTEINKPL